jgi:hypothetical protein
MAPATQRENTLSERTQQVPRDMRVRGNEIAGSKAGYERASAGARLNRPADAVREGRRSPPHLERNTETHDT